MQFEYGTVKTWNNLHDPLHLFCRPLNSSTKAEGWRESVYFLSKSIIYSRDMKGNWCFSSQSMMSKRDQGNPWRTISTAQWVAVFLPPWIVDHGDLSTCCLWALLYIAISWYLCVPFLLLLFILLSFLFMLLCIPLLLLRFVFRNPLRNWAFESTSFNTLGKENGWTEDG